MLQQKAKRFKTLLQVKHALAIRVHGTYAIALCYDIGLHRQLDMA